MSQRKNYYEFLGVPRQATPDQIQAQYRHLARKFHPDANPNNPRAPTVFRQITLAYEVLHDPKRRAEYDRNLPPVATPPAPTPPVTTPPPAVSPASRRSPPRSPLESPAMERLLREAEGDALAEAGQTAEALDAYREALGRKPNPPLQAKIARLENGTGHAAGATSELRPSETEATEDQDRPSLWHRLFRRGEAKD